MANTYSLTFRDQTVRWFASHKRSTNSVHESLHFVLHYRKHFDGSVDFTPSICASFKTAESCKREIKGSPTLYNQWAGQTFIIKALPGVTEITNAEIVEA